MTTSAPRSAPMTVRVDQALPPLAWLAEVEPGGVRLHCGSKVEVREDGFFEGCWADDFARFNFDETANVFGTGGKLVGDTVRFVPPSHTLEAIYLLERAGRILVSNSLAFLVSAEQLELDFDFEIGARFASILNGTVGYERVLFRGADWTLSRIFRERIDVEGGRIRLTPPSDELPFTTYAEYIRYLQTVIRDTFENGASPAPPDAVHADRDLLERIRFARLRRARVRPRLYRGARAHDCPRRPRRFRTRRRRAPGHDGAGVPPHP